MAKKKEPAKVVKFAEWESGPFGGGQYVDPNAPKRVVDDRPLPQIVKEFVRDNPASLATGLAAGLTLPATFPAMLGAGALLAGARAVDKNNMFSDKPSDYKSMNNVDNFNDLLFTGMFGALSQGIFGRAPKGKVTPKSEPVIRVGADRTPVLMDAPVEAGFPPGYKIHNYEAYPIAREIDEQLVDAGIPRFINPPRDSRLSQYLVGNPERNKIIHLPEGQAYRKAVAMRDPMIPDDQVIYSGVKTGMFAEPEMSFTSLRETEKWGSTNRATGNSYASAGVPTAAYKEIILKKIRDGVFNENNLPVGFESVEDLIQTINDPNQYHVTMGKSILRNEPEMTGMVQELIPMASKIKQIDKKGDYWLGKEVLAEAKRMGITSSTQIQDMAHKIQRAHIKQAAEEGHDALQFLNQRDPGPYVKPWDSMEDVSRPSTVHVGIDPKKFKSIYNLGLWDLKDPRILGGLVGGIGAHVAKTDNTRVKQ